MKKNQNEMIKKIVILSSWQGIIKSGTKGGWNQKLHSKEKIKMIWTYEADERREST